ncbi:MAG: hypothetical protein AAGG02_19975 [Cyanobacteria bacterium P01_H01_bin.15]
MLSQFYPLVFFLFSAAVILIAITVGYRLGLRKIKVKKEGQKPSLGSAVGAMLALFGFMLAFTFSTTYSLFSQRKQLLLDDANAIGTAVLRTDFLPEPSRTEARKLFKEYVDIRIDAVQHPDKLERFLQDSDRIQDELWSHVAELSDKTTNPRLLSLYINALNQVIDLHSLRVTVASRYRIPRTVWFMLYFIGIQAMLAVGYELGLSGRASVLAAMLIAFMFSAIIALIADLNFVRPNASITVDQEPMLDLQQKLDALID